MAEADGILLSDRDRAIVQRVLAPYADRIDRVGVFGSRALGTARPSSDIDLVLWGDVDDPLVARLWSRFDASSLALHVDLVAYDPSLAPAFRRHIDQIAKLLFTREQLQRDEAIAPEGD